MHWRLNRETHHSNSVTVEHFVGIHDHVVRYVGQDVDHGNDGHGDGNGQGQVSAVDQTESCVCVGGFFRLLMQVNPTRSPSAGTCTSLGS